MRVTGIFNPLLVALPVIVISASCVPAESPDVLKLKLIVNASPSSSGSTTVLSILTQVSLTVTVAVLASSSPIFSISKDVEAALPTSKNGKTTVSGVGPNGNYTFSFN